MIPTKNVKGIGIREVISEQDADRVFTVLGKEGGCTSSNWNKRYRENMVKIKSGNIYEVADVVRSQC